jgi:hypothetical protein
MHYQLIYHSLAIQTLEFYDIEAILASSRAFNAAHDISGCLLYYNHEFVQLLEGNEKHINPLFERIQADKRHTHVRMILDGEARTKMFSKWFMAYRRLQTLDLDISGGHFNLTHFPGLLKHLNKPETAHKLFANIATSILAEEEKGN